MLVLSRKVGQRIFIGNEEIKVMVVEIKGDKVRLGIEAPEKIPVHREEVFKAIQRSNESLVTGSTLETAVG